MEFDCGSVKISFFAGRRFYAHRIALLASSDAFRAMFDGGYRVSLLQSTLICVEPSGVPIPISQTIVFWCILL